MDTAYSPRLHEEELASTSERILLRMVESELQDHEWRMVESESFLDSPRRMVESWVFAKRGIVRLAAEGRLWRG